MQHVQYKSHCLCGWLQSLFDDCQSSTERFWRASVAKVIQGFAFGCHCLVLEMWRMGQDAWLLPVVAGLCLLQL
jgi:hypothetical protein